MELGHRSIGVWLVEAGAELAAKGRQLQDYLDRMIEQHPDNEEYKEMRGFLADRQKVLYDLLERIPK